jgi:hypothetical protein
VIAADADLDDAVVNYIVELRGDCQKPFLLQNDYKPEGYPVRFIESKDSTPMEAQILADYEAGLNQFISTDSLKGSKNIAEALRGIGANPLLVNSETSVGEIEREFIKNPDANLEGVRVVISSPSMATGVSIEKKHFDKVYGVYYGAASTDADMAQALGRVRDNVPREVWCAKYGRNFSSAGRSVVPFVLKATLKD